MIHQFKMEANDLTEKQSDRAEDIINEALDKLASEGIVFEGLGGNSDRIEIESIPSSLEEIEESEREEEERAKKWSDYMASKNGNL